MEKQGELLTEENYKRGKKKVMRIALAILAVGVLIGGGLIAAGFINITAAQKADAQTEAQLRQEAADSAKAKAETRAQAQANAKANQEQIDTLKNEISTLETELQQIFQEDKGFSSRYNAKQAEINQKQQELQTLQSQSQSSSLSTLGGELGLGDVESEIDNTGLDIKIAQSKTNTSGYQVMIMVGIFIIIASCMISLFVYIFGKRREIAAFATQQTMPVAQETITKMAPTIGNAASEVAKGIKKGLNEADRDSGIVDNNGDSSSQSPSQQ